MQNSLSVYGTTRRPPSSQPARLWIILAASLSTPAADAETRSDYLLFANLTGTHNASAPADIVLDHEDWEPAMTFLYTRETERLRLFTELHATKGGDGEIARLQAGWRFTPQSTLWAGRFHNPQGYWNTQYHHGMYLQTAISRPGIERFDDEGGVLPSHYIGLQLDGSEDIGSDGSLRYELGLGASGVLDEEGLESPAIFMPQRSSKPTASLRATFTPTEGGPLALGAFLGRNRLPADELAAREVTQTVYGAFGTLDYENTRFIGAFTVLRNDVEIAAMGTTTGRFANAYLQAEYQPFPTWTGYLRTEGSSDTDNDPYLVLFPRYIKNQHVAGLRWDLFDKQALKLEYAHPEISAGDYETIAVEWSLIFP